MSEPVFVIHGIGNRDRAAFDAQVAALGEAMGARFDLRPVYWGDLGADDRWVERTIPSQAQRDGSADSHGYEVRDDATMPADLAVTLLEMPAPTAIREEAELHQLDVMTAAALARLVVPSRDPEEVRDGAGVNAAQGDVVREAIAQQWPSTLWLQHVTDDELLQEVGYAVATPLADTTIAPMGEELRDEEVRGPDIGAFVRRRTADLDRVVGAAFSAAGGRLNTYLRTELLPGATRFFGDMLAYQHRRVEIHDRVWAVIDEFDPTLGRDREHPVRIVGHSLGGVIAVDIATANAPLWTSTLVTFGSQPPFFHVCDPRGGQLLPFEGTELVTLPASIGRWTNLWEPMDVLAFIAAKVFRMHDGSAPVDLPVQHLASSGLWTHSVYWRLPHVAATIAEALDRVGMQR